MSLLEIAGTDILYHKTTLSAAVSILQQNRFELKPAEGTSAEQNISDGHYYLSTSRSKTGSYIHRNLTSFSVIIVLDGRRLAQRYRIVPVDYWGTNVEGVDDKLMRRKSNYETEDRVLSKKSEIPAAPYIKAVHCGRGTQDSHEYILFRIHKWCLLHKVPFFIYEEANDLMLMNPRKAIHVNYHSTQPEIKKPTEYDYRKFQRDFRNGFLMRWLKLWMYPLKPNPEGYYGDQAAALGEEANRAYNNLRYSDASGPFEADMHNAKSMPYGSVGRDRETLDKLVSIMRKEKITPKQFVQRLRDKWYPPTR